MPPIDRKQPLAERDPATRAPRSSTRRRSLGAFVIAVAVCAAALLAGSLLTRGGMDGWYDDLAKPSWQPPPWAFSVAWTTIFALKAIALWLVARSPFELPEVRLALALFAIQLVLNVAWSAIFFAAHAPAAALVEIAVLDGFVVMTLLSFGRVSRVAAALLVPYVLWLGLATALNAWIAVNN